MAHTCIEHPHEQAEGLCRKCGASYCADCLVYPFGPAKPPFCIPCAVAQSGVRSNAANPTRVVPKENKRRLKEWRKARKRDLASPPPDGVATWQRMDEAAVEEEEAAAAARAEAEREALRLPPPVPETPTPPPGVNLAPPGPPDEEDWRNQLNQEPSDEPLLGFLDDDEPPTPLLDPVPVPEEPVVESFAGVEEPTPLHVPEFAIDRPAFEPTPFEPAFDPLDEPPLPPATSLDDFGLGGGNFAFEPPSTPYADDPVPPPPPPMAEPVAVAPVAALPPEPAAPIAPPPRTPPMDLPPPASIRPRTPTRIPAAKPEAKESDAKAMLARIAALRADRDD